jgi:hypothetical protein
LAFLAALRPGDPVQAMLAVHTVASHYAGMECFRSAAREVEARAATSSVAVAA